MSLPFQAGAEVLAALDREVREGIRVLPRRGLEIGGLLVGKAAQAVEISGVRSVEIEHRFGPSFVLSEADVQSFRTAIGEASVEAIGHFRSQTKGEPESREADDLIADLLGVSKPVLLVIPVDNGNPGPGRLYRRENGVWSERGQPAAQAETVAVVRPHRAAVKAAGARASPKWRLALVTAVVLIGAVIFHYAARQRPVSPPVSQSRIGLSVERGTGALMVRWDATSPAIQQAVSGVLFIGDGGAQREVALSRELLLEGKVFYAPQSPVAEFRLQVYRDGQHYVAEGVRIETGVTAPKFSAAFEVEKAPALVKEADRMAVQPNAANVESRETPRRILSLPTRPLITASAAEHATPPPEAGRIPAAVGSVPEILGRLPAVAPPAVSYVAAVPLRRVNASVPAHLRSAIKASTAVEVKVSIDESGKVINAIPVTAASFEAQLLAPQATQAARLWSFSPARRNGQPQSSELLLTFTFDRGSAQ